MKTRPVLVIVSPFDMERESFDPFFFILTIPNDVLFPILFRIRAGDLLFIIFFFYHQLLYMRVCDFVFRTSKTGLHNGYIEMFLLCRKVGRVY